MKRFGKVAALVMTAGLLGAGAARAQLPGIPYGPVETGLGIGVAADYARPEGGGTAYGVTGGFGFSRFGLSASVGAIDAGTDSEVSLGGRLGMKLFGGGLNPVSVGAQVGFASVQSIDLGPPVDTVRMTTVLPGAWVRFSPPLFPLKPWGVVYYRTGSNVPDPAKEIRFAIGANFNLLLGLGVHGAYDWGDSGSTWGVGAHFNFRVPGLGVPGVPGM